MISWLLFNIGLLIVAYLLGSMATGYWVGSWFYSIDIRECGSGSTGATNVLRNIGKFPALMVLIIDILKGVLAIALIRYVYSLDAVRQLATAAETSDFANLFNFLARDAVNLQPWMVTFAGLAAAIGHSKSIWIGFKGGKAVATSLGILLAMSWQVGLGTLGVFALVIAISRIVSLSSIAGAIATSALMYFAGEPLAYQIFAIAGGIFVIWRHRTNIERLLVGTEPRIGQKLSTES